ncbi:coiled-coil domain-containing protein 28B isoform X2 [Neocloeon triangulifer]|uniref:coiled-coil domain-containing protein 28B isoform X2 n=1 Tax=Neocloeon triangulifer TaxID=2078957 RepID=UPI00286F41C4|nr:coiled-coil domain-containing protein 28B isoform X2 [Neocloeon triangulifer]
MMGEECELRQLMLSTEADEEDSPEREDQPPPPPVMPPARMRNKSSSSPAKELQPSREAKSQTPMPAMTTKVVYVNEKSESRDKNLDTRQGSVRSAARMHKPRKDVADVRGMEKALLKLLEDFHSGQLRAFGQDCSMEQMEAIREQQERLARMHFDLGAQQELYAPLSDEGLRSGQENLDRLMGALEQLSLSIEQLHSNEQDGLVFSD